MNKKYQIFISSTYEDLVEERKEVQDAILKLDHFPVGMELFGARSTSQWNVIKRTLDTSDYYVLIIGYRYGSVADDGVGYTEKEFRYAKDKGIPIIAFIKERGLPVTRKSIETLPENQEKLNKFIESVTDNREVAWWSSKEELCNKVITSLHKEFYENEGCGWTRQEDLKGHKNIESNSSSFPAALENIGCHNIYFDLSSDQRNSAKRNQIKKTKMLCLHAKTGYSFIAQNGTFYPDVRESLSKGMSFSAVIQNPWSLNALISALNDKAFDNKDDYQNYLNGKLSCQEILSIYKCSDWYERFKMCLKGFKKLKREYGDKVNLRLDDMDLSNSILLSEESLFLEHSVLFNTIGDNSLPLYEFEFTHSSKIYADCKKAFYSAWERSYEYKDFIIYEPILVRNLKKVIETRQSWMLPSVIKKSEGGSGHH